MSDTAAALPDALVDELWARADAAALGVSRSTFVQALERSCRHRLGERCGRAAVDVAAVETYLRSLHVADLALACACRDGVEAAWDRFMRDVQPLVRAAARAMAGDRGPDLADALVAELYGTNARDGGRRSLFEYFHGRSRLTTWLRTVVAQRWVDQLRADRRDAPLEPWEGSLSGPPAPALVAGDATVGLRAAERGDAGAVHGIDRGPLLRAFERELEVAVDALEAGDRLRLSYYHVHGLTLSRIGRLLGEHESSVSRKLDRARRAIRDRVERALREQHGFGEADLQQCYEEASRLGSLDVAHLLAECKTAVPSPFRDQDQS